MRIRLPALLGAVLTLVLLWTDVAGAELTAKGGLFVRFDGGIAPKKLPRTQPAPIAVRIEGTIRAAARREPPALRGIRIALNRDGRLDATGLPVCRRFQI